MQPTQRVFVLFALGVAACGSKDPADEGNRWTAPANATADTGTQGSRADSGAGGLATCPITRPAEATVCQITAALCAYDEIECRCPSGLWSCVEPVHPGCPASAPASGSSCALPDATECDYLQQECECLSGVWACEAETDGGIAQGPDGGATPWLDGGARRDGAVGLGTDGGPDAGGGCPEGRPAELTTCVRSNATCTYESTECVCPDGLWSCSEPVDVGCPATTPLHGEACSGFADCDFLEVECECILGSWNCKPND